MARDALAKALYSHLFDYLVKVGVYSSIGSHLKPFIYHNRNYKRRSIAGLWLKLESFCERHIFPFNIGNGNFFSMNPDFF